MGLVLLVVASASLLSLRADGPKSVAGKLQSKVAI